MRSAALAFAFMAAALATAAPEARAGCFNDCFGSKMQGDTDDIAAKDFARECRATCDAQSADRMASAGVDPARLQTCKAERLSLEQFRDVRAASPSYRVQSNIFLWDVVNPYPDKALTRIEVSTQTLELQELTLTGTGLAPPSSTATFVIPEFYEGYPAVRFTAKIRAIWACEVK
ncbi:hypothetical protein ACFSCV_13825 [Methylopila henanensis]|uniref:Uncharacterized protein n=1 Tax=Methylopila henanensis TaxID=873516 RepID=A0ABW4KAH3_9HYPH